MNIRNFIILVLYALFAITAKAQTTWTHTFTQEDNISNTTTSFSISDKEWNLTWDTSKTNNKDITWYGSNYFLKYGSGNHATYPIFSTTDFKGIISCISIEAKTNQSADQSYISVTVGGKNYGTSQKIVGTTLKAYTFTGEETGEINISFTKVGYIKSFSITYTDGSSLRAPQLAFTQSSYTLEIGSDEYKNFTSPVLTNNHNVNVTYSSSNTDIASVDASTGNVTLGTTVGTTTISAISAVDETYKADTASYTITLTSPVLYEWKRTELTELQPTDEFLIVDTNSKLLLPTTNDSEHSPAGISVRLNDELTAATLNNSTSEESVVWNVSGTQEGYTFYPAGQTEKYLRLTKDESESLSVGTDDKNYHSSVFIEVIYNTNDDGTIEYKTLKNTQYSRCLIVTSDNKDWRSYDESVMKEGNYKTSLGYYKKTSKTPSYTTQVIKPTINIDENYCVSISADSGCTIYYTTDNSDVINDGKLSGNAILYSDKSFTLSKATTIKAIAMDADGNISEISTESFDYHGILSLPYYENFDEELGNFAVENTISETNTQSPRWKISEYSEDQHTYKYATVTGKDDNSTVYNIGSSRLLTPFISLKGYETVKLYFVHSGNNLESDKIKEGCQLYYRTSVSGKWTQLDIPTPFTCSSDFTLYNSGDITLLDKENQITTLDADSLIQLSFLFCNNATSDDNYGTWNIHKLVVTGSRHDGDESCETVTLKSDGFATYVTQNEIDWSKTRNNNQVSGFKVIEFDNNTVVLQEFGTGIDEVENITPAETPIVIKGTKGENLLTIAKTNEHIAKVANNQLHPSYGNITASASQNLYVIQTGSDGVKGWYKLASQTIPHRKAYLNGAEEIDEVMHKESNPAKGIYTSMADVVTGVKEISPNIKSNDIYNLNGMRVYHLTKGLYIVKGKKIIVK